MIGKKSSKSTKNQERIFISLTAAGAVLVITGYAAVLRSTKNVSFGTVPFGGEPGGVLKMKQNTP